MPTRVLISSYHDSKARHDFDNDSCRRYFSTASLVSVMYGSGDSHSSGRRDHYYIDFSSSADAGVENRLVFLVFEELMRSMSKAIII